MLWEEDTEKTYAVPDDIIDVMFSISCRTLPVDHAYALSQAVCRALPWFEKEADAGLHLIHMPESGNGWNRADGPDGLFYLSRRAKLILRIPGFRAEDAKLLSGQTLDVGGYTLQAGSMKKKPLSRETTLFARYVLTEETRDENDFQEDALEKLHELGIACRKFIPGKTHYFATPTGKLFTRSLLAADLSVKDAISLQQKGLGAGRKIGCGLFIPHKGIKPMR